MTLQPTSGENQVYYNDVTNQYHLVNIDPVDGTITDLGVIAQADQLTALASLETQQDLTTAAVASLEIQQEITTAAFPGLLAQQKITNLHLSSITGLELTTEDTEES